MGAWGAGVFDNDDAAVWIEELEGLELEDLVEIFDELLESDDYMEVDQCNVALAAAACIAATRSGTTADHPEEVTEFARRIKSDVRAEALHKARRTVEKLRDDENSELRALYEESDAGKSAWLEVMNRLVTELT